MRKLITTTILTLALSPTPALAFTLGQAHGLASRTEQATWGSEATVLPCSWQTKRKAACPVITAPLTVTPYSPPVVYQWTDVVTRNGACSRGTVKRIAPGVWESVSNGGSMHNCYTGPLTVTSIDLVVN